VRAVTIGGRVIATGLFSNLAGDTGVLIQDAVTGALLGSAAVADDWVFTMPDGHLSTATVGASSYAVVLGRRSTYAVIRLTPDGPLRVGAFQPDAIYVNGVAAGQIGGLPVVFAWGESEVGAYRLLTGERVGHVWTAPAGWRVDAVVRAGRRAYVWLAHDDDRCWLWDAASGAPVRPPVRIRGLRWGPWDLAGRPALLRLVWRQRYELWDLALGEPVGIRAPGPSVKRCWAPVAPAPRQRWVQPVDHAAGLAGRHLSLRGGRPDAVRCIAFPNRRSGASGDRGRERPPPVAVD
jgi:hypothetical protein